MPLFGIANIIFAREAPYLARRGNVLSEERYDGRRWKRFRYNFRRGIADSHTFGYWKVR